MRLCHCCARSESEKETYVEIYMEILGLCTYACGTYVYEIRYSTYMCKRKIRCAPYVCDRCSDSGRCLGSTNANCTGKPYLIHPIWDFAEWTHVLWVLHYEIRLSACLTMRGWVVADQCLFGKSARRHESNGAYFDLDSAFVSDSSV
jgi:hypothetical protein